MGTLTLLMWVIFPLLIIGQEQSESDSSNGPSTDFVFDLPDIVATHDTLWGEIQLEAFGARQVKGNNYTVASAEFLRGQYMLTL